MVGYTDSDWAGEADGRSRAAFVFELAGAAFCWSSRKLDGAATSTTLAEYKALSEGAKEAVWLRQLLQELGQGHGPIVLRCDNKSSIQLSGSRCRLHTKTKHLKVAWHFIKDAIRDGDVVVEFVSTWQQDADMLTKAQDGPLFKANRMRIGLQPMHGQRQGLGVLIEGMLSG